MLTKPDDTDRRVSEVRAILVKLHYPGYRFLAERRGTCVFLFASYFESDIRGGPDVIQETRSWLIKDGDVPSAIVQTAFKCVLTSSEHRVREHFRYRGKRIFGPHFSVDSLHDICTDKHLDYEREDHAANEP